MPDIASVTSQKTIEQIIQSQSEKKEARNTGELGKNDFLQLLITQVQNQDPLNPTSDTDFIAQMAQFSALEQMQNLNQSFSYSMGFSMMGKYISASYTDESTGEMKYVEGIVDMVRVVNGKVHAVVNGNDVPVDKITQVSTNNVGLGGKVTDYSAIVGMLGKSYISNTDGDISTIEGIISQITKESGAVYAELDEVDILPHNLDIGAFEDVEEYINTMAGEEVTLRFKDPETGHIFKVTGTLRGGYEAKDGSLHLVLDDVKVPASSIYSTEQIDLLSTEQMLLNEILKELRKQNSSGEDETDPGSDDPVDGTEDTGTGSEG